jgi:hypothetical protein
MTTLADIRTKVRNLTGRPSANQITDATIDNYVNTFYLYDLPNHLRLFNLKTTYTFSLAPDVSRYIFPVNTYVSIEPPVYVSGYPIQFYQSKQTFYKYYPERLANETLTTGNGGPGPYAGTTIGTPILRNRVFVSTVDVAGNSLTATDNGLGVFAGNVIAGAVNYATGAITNLTWTANIANGTNIQVQYFNYQAARPTAVLFFDDIFEFRAVPNQAYEVSMDAYILPTQLINTTDEPAIREWWQTLALGGALKVFEDNLDMESYSKIRPIFEEQLSLIERRTLQQIKNSSTATIYDESRYFGYPWFSSGS